MPLVTGLHNKTVGALIANTPKGVTIGASDITSLSYTDADGHEVLIPETAMIVARYEYPSKKEGYPQMDKFSGPGCG